MSDIFNPAMQRPNAKVVTEGIARVEPKGVYTKDGRLHELDLLVLATGFDGYNFLRSMEGMEQGGRTLDQAWAEADEAYRSVAVPNFPNFFMLVGPNSPVGNLAN